MSNLRDLKRLSIPELRKVLNKSDSLIIMGATESMGGHVENVYFIRDGEVSLAEFRAMKEEEQEKHIEFLSTLGFENLGMNDEFILNSYTPPSKNRKRTMEQDFYTPSTGGIMVYTDNISKEELQELVNEIEPIKTKLLGILKTSFRYLEEGDLDYINKNEKDKFDRYFGDIIKYNNLNGKIKKYGKSAN
jgi:hypothetical protein